MTTKIECEFLLNFLLPKAEYFLKKNGEFYPLSVILNNKKEIIPVAMQYDTEFPKSTDVIQDSRDYFQVEAQNSKLRATAIIYDGFHTDAETGKKSDAFFVELDHLENYSVLIVYPYTRTNDEIIFQEPIAYENDYKIFPLKS